MTTFADDDIQMCRKIYRQDDIDRDYPLVTADKSFRTKLKSIFCTCNIIRAFPKFLVNLFPIVKVLKSYRKNYVLSDFLAGLSSGFMHLPQGLGFGLLASLQPIYGLYATFYPILIYLIFGTSQHVSLGTNAVMAVMTAAIVEREAGLLVTPSGINNVTASLTTEEILEYKVGVAMAVTFLAGIVLFCMGIFRLGFLTNYLAVSFIGGFTTASAIHITTSQIGKMLNIEVKPYAGAGKVIKTYVEIASKITQTNMADLTISILSIIILLLVKICVNDRFKSKLKVPIPIDLILVIVATLISYTSDLNGRFQVAVVGPIPTGMPAPKLPNFKILSRVGSDSFVIAILIFALTISMAKLMAKLNQYEIDDNQELVAYGASNLISSFFMCFPCCVSPPRTMILQSLGSRTTLNGITSAVFILIILLVAAPLFEALPVAVLAAMIVVAMKELLLQFHSLPGIWRVSKADFVIWISTFLVGVFMDLDFGIAAGVGVSVLTVVINNQLSRGYVVGQPSGKNLFIGKMGRNNIQDIPGVRVFTFEAQLYFVNAERFRNLLYKTATTPKGNPDKDLINYNRRNSELYIPQDSEECVDLDPDINPQTDTVENHDALEEHGGNIDAVSVHSLSNPREVIHHVIIDCVHMTYIDMSGINILKQIQFEYANSGVELFLARVPMFTLETLQKADYFKTFNRQNVFYDVIDAVQTARQRSLKE